MDEKVARIQERLRAQLSQPVASLGALRGRPVVGFEVVSGVPNGAENLVPEVIAELKRRGHRVAHVMRYGCNSVPAVYQADPAQAAFISNARLVVTPERTVLTREVSAEPDLASLIDQLGEGYDIVVCEGFEYQHIPKVMITRKVQEAFNLGLPNIVAYVSCKDAGAQIPQFTPVQVSELTDFLERRVITPNADRSAC